jgi:hypothetical protein
VRQRRRVDFVDDIERRELDAFLDVGIDVERGWWGSGRRDRRRRGSGRRRR